KLIQVVHDFDAHLGVLATPVSSTETALSIAPVEAPSLPDSAMAEGASGTGTPGKIRVGGNVQSTKLIVKVTPPYPADAKKARIQGTVRLTAVIAKDGTVQSLEPVMGPDVLVTAAL